MATLPINGLTAQQVSHAIITAAMKVHTKLGPGLLKSTYTACLQYELARAGLRSATQVGLPVVYFGVKLELGYRMDLWRRILWWWRSSRWRLSRPSITRRFFRTSSSVANPLDCL
jgi:hypothetical protein